MQAYTHKVQYYETDQMAFVHHSNYIRWFEEARIWFMEQVGAPYDAMEAQGFISPVRGAHRAEQVLKGGQVWPDS